MQKLISKPPMASERPGDGHQSSEVAATHEPPTNNPLSDVPSTRIQAHQFDRFSDAPDKGQLETLYADAVENVAYFQACESTAASNFEVSGIAAKQADAHIIAASPVFRTAIDVGVLFEGVTRAIVKNICLLFPHKGNIKLAGLGTPYSHESRLMFAPGTTREDRCAALDAMLESLEQTCRAEDIEYALVKDISATSAADLQDVFKARKYACVTALPLAKLKVPESEDAYFKSLSGNMRSNLRRRLKRARHLRLEVRTDTVGIEDDLRALHYSTLNRAQLDYDAFSELPDDYFQRVLADLGGKARLLTYWRDDQMLGFSLVLVEANRLIQTYNGMRYPDGPDNGLFYLDWMSQLRFCIENGIAEMQPGVTTYLIKARLGCTFHRSYIYLRHVNRWINPPIHFIASRINLEKSDPGLCELGDRAPFAK